MMAYDITTFVNIFAFVGMTITAYAIFYVARSIKQKNVGLNLVMLALGINFIGMSYLFRVWFGDSAFPFEMSLVGFGSLLLSIGVIWVFYEKGMEVQNLKRRENDIRGTIERLKEKYYRREISEEELESMHTDMLKELAEIEVKLSKKGK
jgi:uncharacterized membrane protein